MEEQLYKFIDKSGSCFDELSKQPDCEILQHWLKRGKLFGVGDMLAFRDELVSYGFKWGRDFYVIKVDN